MLYIIKEDAVVGQPQRVKKFADKIRMEVVLQTLKKNQNGRFYPREVLDESIGRIVRPRIVEKTFLGELDHPIDAQNPARQLTVLYKDSSHKFLEMGWDGDKLIGVIETLSATNNGRVLRDLVIRDDIPVGFSFRGTGKLEPVTEGNIQYMKVQSPLTTITWDSVSTPSHAGARLVKITENIFESIQQSIEETSMLNEGTMYFEENGMICTNEGVCYLPDAFDKLVEKRFIKISESYNL
jgi:hypothetical protein